MTCRTQLLRGAGRIRISSSGAGESAQMTSAVAALDRLVGDGKVAADWPRVLRAVDPSIDVQIDRCVSKLAHYGPYTPHAALIWRAYELSPSDVRVLILGQDPYPDPTRTTGLAFSTGPNGPIADSLKFIVNELGPVVTHLPADGDLSGWTKEGVFLLNRALTLPLPAANGPRVHFGLWAPVLRATLKAIAAEGASRPIAAMLWGAKARVLRKYLEPGVKVFTSSHPSPRWATRDDGVVAPFVGSGPFAAVDGWFADQIPAMPPINWEL